MLSGGSNNNLVYTLTADNIKYLVVTLTTDNIKYNLLRCSTGYTLVGYHTLTCTGLLKWNENLPQCVYIA